MSTFLEAVNNLAGFETHDIDQLGPVNIRKPGLADLEKVESLQKDGEESAENVQGIAKMIGLDFIVDDSCKPVFTEDNIDTFMNIPMDIQLDIIAAFKKTFSKISEKAEELKKKL